MKLESISINSNRRKAPNYSETCSSLKTYLHEGGSPICSFLSNRNKASSLTLASKNILCGFLCRTRSTRRHRFMHALQKIANRFSSVKSLSSDIFKFSYYFPLIRRLTFLLPVLSFSFRNAHYAYLASSLSSFLFKFY